MTKLSVDQALIKARSLAKKGNFQEAQKLYEGVLQAFPENKRAQQGLAALSQPKQPNATQSPSQKTINQLINLYNQGQLAAVFGQAKALTRQYPNELIIWSILGSAAAQTGQIADAIKAFKRVISIKPDFAEAHYNLGIALKDQGKLEEAKEAYKKALSLKPDYAEACNNMGVVLQDQGKLEEAKGAYKKALSLKPDYAEAYNNMANVLKDQGKLDEATKVYKKALSLKPDYAEPYNNMGIVLQDQGKLEEAIEAYKKALSLKPDYAEAHNNIGIVLQDQGKLEEAIEAYKKALSLKPDYAETYNNMGNVFKDGRKLKEAIEAYKKALLLKPDYAEPYNNMGNVLKDQGKLAEAIEAYKKALSLKPDYGEASHILSSLTGKTTNSAPREYVENLFDGYAHNFDQSLAVDLSYDIPEVMTQLALEKHGGGSLGSILDLGCGTGLTGEKIRPHCAKLEGIDLSRKMLEIAHSRAIYDNLEHVDIVEYLSSAELNFDYFIATDVFIYVGDLSEVFHLIKVRNKKPAKLIFSTEHTKEKGFHLEKSGRYSHSKSYIEELCKEFKFSISHFSETNLRKEKNVFLIGGLYFLDF